MSLLREVTGFRFVQTNRGDSLQAIALRELGDAERWPELVALNELRPPFLVDGPDAAAEGVVVTGGLLRVPSSASSVEVTDPDLVFEVDVQLEPDGGLAADGDFVLASGQDNLRQALRNRLQTDQGELVFHPGYGSQLRRIVGSVNGPTAALLAASYAKTAIQADTRVQRIVSSEAQVVGDRVSVDVVAEPIVGRAMQVSEVV